MDDEGIAASGVAAVYSDFCGGRRSTRREEEAIDVMQESDDFLGILRYSVILPPEILDLIYLC